MFNKNKDFEIHGGTFTHVSGNVNQINAQNLFVQYEGEGTSQKDPRKRGRQLSLDESNTADLLIGDSTNDPVGSSTTRPPAKKGRMDGDNASSGRISDFDAIMLAKLPAAKNAGRSGSKSCLNGTRVQLLERIQTWAMDPTGKRALLLSGAAGMAHSNLDEATG
ncbi:hypothetical protein H0H92_003317 [Tricholoma furcatifolium]|nr:hypothetical protein H0H92_003317 [Tricholoma furcatifolium]